MMEMSFIWQTNVEICLTHINPKPNDNAAYFMFDNLYNNEMGQFWLAKRWRSPEPNPQTGANITVLWKGRTPSFSPCGLWGQGEFIGSHSACSMTSHQQVLPRTLDTLPALSGVPIAYHDLGESLQQRQSSVSAPKLSQWLFHWAASVGHLPA